MCGRVTKTLSAVGLVAGVLSGGWSVGSAVASPASDHSAGAIGGPVTRANASSRGFDAASAGVLQRRGAEGPGSDGPSVASGSGTGGALSNGLSNVSCASSTMCVAVGSYYVGGGRSVPLIESWNGSTWSINPGPGPVGSTSGLQDVSCISSTECVAVGSYSPGPDETATLVESWNGSTWTIVSSPDASGQYSALEGVSCAGPTECVAVGNYGNDTGTLAESWNGSAWSIVPSPKPGHDQHSGQCVVPQFDGMCGGRFRRGGGKEPDPDRILERNVLDPRDQPEPER